MRVTFMDIKKNMFAGALVAVLLLASPASFAAIGKVTAKVSQVLHVDDTTFGSCMAELSVDPSKTGVSCKTWVSFSCSGHFNTKDAAYRMFDMAQMAMALDKTVVVWVDDARKHNSFCVARRIYVEK